MSEPLHNKKANRKHLYDLTIRVLYKEIPIESHDKFLHQISALAISVYLAITLR